MNSQADQLRDDVFKCELCTQVEEFSRPANGKPFFKFPPIIGAEGEADLLFVGINPRRSDSNLELHDWLLDASGAFGQLAKNIQKDGNCYIRKYSDEQHYDCHLIIVEGVFGAGTAFKAKAAVTELLFCASAKAPTILKEKKSPCAELYFHRVLAIVKPKVIIAVGNTVRRHLEEHFKDKRRVPVARMAHPAFLNRKSWAEKMHLMQPTIDDVLMIMGKG